MKDNTTHTTRDVNSNKSSEEKDSTGKNRSHQERLDLKEIPAGISIGGGLFGWIESLVSLGTLLLSKLKKK